VRGRCKQIWDAAKAQKLCSGENPFDWKTLKPSAAGKLVVDPTA
jgi:hypothetical protein